MLPQTYSIHKWIVQNRKLTRITSSSLHHQHLRPPPYPGLLSSKIMPRYGVLQLHQKKKVHTEFPLRMCAALLEVYNQLMRRVPLILKPEAIIIRLPTHREKVSTQHILHRYYIVDDVLEDLSSKAIICSFLKALDSKSLFKITLAYPWDFNFEFF